MLKSTVPSEVVLRQYSKWIDAANFRLFIVLDAWHGLHADTKLLDVQKEEEVYRTTEYVMGRIRDGSLLPF
ncbi:hypothetical protein [Fibrella aestuarina]|uniref:hypothetical protein n=1 Tax=Fibrella aestuarina TaxID=651143 RepID=UPI00031A5A6D|nr:hypothetical protein [Fibrella aestuarina]